MGRKLEIILTASQKIELEKHYRQGDSHAFRQRCRMVLLKATGITTKEICKIVGIKSENQVNIWIKRYKSEYNNLGIDVLHNMEGQGRKPTFDGASETERIKTVVQQERQKLSKAKVILENELNKTFTLKTLQNFLKALAADTNDLDVM